LSLSYPKYGFGIWDSRSGIRKNLFRIPGQKKGTGSRIRIRNTAKKLRIQIQKNTVFFPLRLTCAVCRKVFKEARALRYHQIHHPQLLATPPPQQQQQQHSVSATAPAMMNGGFAGSFLNGCDYELDNKSGMISRKNQCTMRIQDVYLGSEFFASRIQGQRGTGSRIIIRSKYI
jgi:hypothetical protein